LSAISTPSYRVIIKARTPDRNAIRGWKFVASSAWIVKVRSWL
jgi:hypothetical protein